MNPSLIISLMQNISEDDIWVVCIAERLEAFKSILSESFLY